MFSNLSPERRVTTSVGHPSWISRLYRPANIVCPVCLCSASFNLFLFLNNYFPRSTRDLGQREKEMKERNHEINRNVVLPWIFPCQSCGTLTLPRCLCYARPISPICSLHFFTVCSPYKTFPHT